jgi:glycosyltransferase involved in cell wall biosynthesis
MEAFAKIAPRHPQWSLEIFGEGPERKSLETLIRNRGLTGRVTLRGLVSDIHSHLVAADLYVMSSRYEGFPLALLEAMACGCPVISTDCPSGPKEIIRVGHDGWLVPREDVDALADGMSRLMDSEVERRRLGANATAICERFSIAKILAMWDDLFARVSSGRERTAVVSRIEGTPSPAKRVA